MCVIDKRRTVAFDASDQLVYNIHNLRIPKKPSMLVDVEVDTEILALAGNAMKSKRL